MNRRISVGFILLVILVGGLSWAAGLSRTQPKASKTYTDEELLRIIVKDIPALTYKGKPVVRIYSVAHREDKWYVVTIKSLRPVKTFVPVRLVLLNQGEPSNKLTVVQGPDVQFSTTEHADSEAGYDITALNMPDWVILELQKS